MASATLAALFVLLCVALSAAAPRAAAIKNMKIGDSIECQICNWAVGEVESLLAANQTEQAIIGVRTSCKMHL